MFKKEDLAYFKNRWNHYVIRVVEDQVSTYTLNGVIIYVFKTNDPSEVFVGSECENFDGDSFYPYEDMMNPDTIRMEKLLRALARLEKKKQKDEKAQGR